MKKITKNDFSKKLAKYGALSLAIAGVADASGQIVYTDLDPDVTQATGGVFPFDLNNDGTDDFSLDIFDAAGGAGAVIFTGINGSLNSNSVVGNAAGPYFYPSNLSSGAIIDSNATAGSSVRGDLNFYGCAYTNSQFCGGVTDGFIGLVFKLNGDTHYGWVRLDLSTDASSMTIKDFAYESTPDTAISAGDGALGVADNTFKGFDYFVDSNNMLTLKASSAMQNVQLYSLLGQEVITQQLSSNNETVNLSKLSTGVYLATVTIEGTKKTFKIAKN